MLNQSDNLYSNTDNELINIDARKLLSINRLDLVVRALLFKDIIDGNLTSEIESLYARTILSRNGASEYGTFFTMKNKEGISDFFYYSKKIIRVHKK